MKRIAIVFLALALVGLAPRDGAPAEATATPTVVELFTSQSCYSCPPAEIFLGELAGRPDVLALEFHVDYWDDLVYGSAGKWKDAFSKPAHTQRQRGYNVSLRGKNSVYTPQMVIDGAAEAVGFRRGAVFSAIEAAASNNRPRVRVALSAGAARGLTIRLAGDAAGPATVWLLRFLRAQTTRVAAGENKDKTLTNHHVVTAIERIGAWRGEASEVVLPEFRLAPEEGCAVVIQDDRPGPILGAAACPLDSS